MNNNVLEAAIYSLQTHPDAGLQAQVDARIREIVDSQQARPSAGNSLFEVAAAYYGATGKEDLLNLARKSADSIYSTFISENPPFSGGERDTINCVQLYRAAREKKYLDLAKHYLDIRGVGDVGPGGGLIFHVNPNYAADGWRYLEAAPFDQSAGAPWGCFRILIPGARGTAVGAGRQNTREILASCAEPGSAASLCANFKLNGIRGWFLPSTEELKLMYVNLKLAGLGGFGDSVIPDNYTYWSSTQRTADMADHLDFADNGRRQHYDDKDYPRRVRAIRAL